MIFNSSIESELSKIYQDLPLIKGLNKLTLDLEKSISSNSKNTLGFIFDSLRNTRNLKELTIVGLKNDFTKSKDAMNAVIEIEGKRKLTISGNSNDISCITDIDIMFRTLKNLKSLTIKWGEFHFGDGFKESIQNI